MATHLAIVDEEGMVRVPADGANPGQTVTVWIVRGATHPEPDLRDALVKALKPIYHDGVRLTKETATSPELQDMLLQR